jgi:hypothetical protein
MIKFRIKTNMFAVAAICALSVLLPTESFANLNDIACDAIWRGCLDKCGSGGNTQTCTNKCDNRRQECALGLPRSEQQTPPPPCRGIHCTLRNPHPPTSVGPTTPRPRPVKPVEPVGVSNPNKTNTGTSGPVILLRKNDSGGGQGQEHGHGH